MSASGLGGPTTNRRRLLNHTEHDMLELEARAGIYAGTRSNIGDKLDGLSGGVHSPQQDMRGWTVQQPFTHVDCPVLHLCIMCTKVVDPDFLRDHQCAVLHELELMATWIPEPHQR